MDLLPLDADTVIAFLEDEVDTNLTLPTLSELFPTNAHQTAQNQRTTHDPTTPSALPGNSQKGMTMLYLNGHCYIKKRTLKASRDWKCTNKQCRGTIKTALDSYVVLKSKSHNRRAVSVINDVGKQEMATYLAVSHGMQ